VSADESRVIPGLIAVSAERRASRTGVERQFARAALFIVKVTTTRFDV
jgi:hypothetical protein